MFCVGLTGNIASGKSTVASFFSQFGVDVISADVIAKMLTLSTQTAFQTIVKHFGDHILASGGEINRRYLRQLIFSQPEERAWLESYLHPLIRHEIEQQIARSHSPYCMIEIPLLNDRALYPYLNRVLLIEAEPTQQIRRLTARDDCTQKEGLVILATQPSILALRLLADDIIVNSQSISDLKKHIEQLHLQYLDYAG